MFTLPYQTTMGLLYKEKLPQIVSKLKRGNIEFPFPAVTTPNQNVLKNSGFVTPRREHDEISDFTQLINLGTDKEPQLIIDARQYMKYDDRTETYRLIAQNDWQLQCVRLALTNALLTKGAVVFDRLGQLPAKVFHRWAVARLVDKYHLTPESQMACWVIAAYYYYGLLDPELAEANFSARQSFAPIISQITSVPPDFILNTIEKVGPLQNANDFIHALSNNTYQARTGDLKFNDLYLLLNSSWIGIHSRENIGVALEHVPTFVAILYMALADRSYRKSTITERADQMARGNDLNTFVGLVNTAVMAEYTNR